MEKEYIIQAFRQADLPCTDKQAEQLTIFYHMLTEKNQVMNLTAITDFRQVVYRHFLDSVYGGKYISTDKGGSLIDIGTGAGFPGIPLKICYPALQVTLMDSLNKRIGFLKEVIQELGLTDIDAVHSRAEDLGRNSSYREQYDWAVSRAVANLSVLSEYSLPFVKPGGYFLSYKSGEVKEESQKADKAAMILGGRIEEIKEYSYTVPGGDEIETEIYHRTIVMIKKIKSTGKKYPRKAGMPAKEPL